MPNLFLSSRFDCEFSRSSEKNQNQVFRQERFGGHYGEAVYVLSNFLSSVPFVAAISISSGTILYYMVNLHRGFSQYWYLCFNLFFCIAVTETSTLIVSTLVPNLLMSIGASAGLDVSSKLLTGIEKRIKAHVV